MNIADIMKVDAAILNAQSHGSFETAKALAMIRKQMLAMLDEGENRYASNMLSRKVA